LLTIAQKQAIYVAVKKSYTIGAITISPNPTVIYQGQTSTNYPQIILNYTDEGGLAQGAVGNYINATKDKAQRSLAHLSFNIEAKDKQGLNRNDIASNIALQLFRDIQENWNSLSSGTVRGVEISTIRNLTHTYLSQQIKDIARYQFDVTLAYDISW